MYWTSVDDRLPTTFTNVLVTDSREGYHVAFHNTQYDQWFSVCNRQLYDVTHWMLLPEYEEPQDNPSAADGCISVERHNELVSRLASEMYSVVGALYAANGAVPSSAYEAILDKLTTLTRTPDVLRSSEDLLVPCSV